ncbi:hypothetical protein OnM2_104027 [Erysiphe neolycopersici]|uniref:Uncharacterized protein n=1 Tax=Erysiphe neolycopersici TaxID=212602 RepID=A0A420H7V5_9PEZI|nr:hypothetical protein OnM2_104027 [Erysiphe neolycopersici]
MVADQNTQFSNSEVIKVVQEKARIPSKADAVIRAQWVNTAARSTETSKSHEQAYSFEDYLVEYEKQKILKSRNVWMKTLDVDLKLPFFSLGEALNMGVGGASVDQTKWMAFADGVSSIYVTFEIGQPARRTTVPAAHSLTDT